MEIAIDKGFLTSFFKHNSSDLRKHLFDDFVRFIKKLEPGFTLISDFSSLDEIKVAAQGNTLLELIIEKVPKLVFLSDLNRRVREICFYEGKNCMKLFLLDCPTSDCEVLEMSYGYSFICGENFKSKWEPYYSDRDDTTLFITPKTSMNDNLRFDSWETLKKFGHPLNALLIVDNYILSDKNNQRIDQNLKPLLLNLLPKQKTVLPIDITIISEVEPWNISFKEVLQDLEEFLTDALPELYFNLNILKFDRTILDKLPDRRFNTHDRRIITNNFWIESGIGFNLMNNNGRLSKSNSIITFRFNLFGSNYVGLKHMLKDYAAYANIAKDLHTFGPKKKNRLLAEY